MFYGVGWVTCKKPGVVYSKRIIFKVSAIVEKLTKIVEIIFLGHSSQE